MMICIPFATLGPKPSTKQLFHLDLRAHFMHFWDPMKELVHFAASTAPVPGAAATRTRMGMIMTIITTPTRERGAIG